MEDAFEEVIKTVDVISLCTFDYDENDEQPSDVREALGAVIRRCL